MRTQTRFNLNTRARQPVSLVANTKTGEEEWEEVSSHILHLTINGKLKIQEGFEEKHGIRKDAVLNRVAVGDF